MFYNKLISFCSSAISAPSTWLCSECNANGRYAGAKCNPHTTKERFLDWWIWSWLHLVLKGWYCSIKGCWFWGNESSLRRLFWSKRYIFDSLLIFQLQYPFCPNPSSFPLKSITQCLEWLLDTHIVCYTCHILIFHLVDFNHFKGVATGF